MRTKAFSFSVVAWQVDDQRCWDCGRFFGTFILKKLESFRQAHALNTKAWNCCPVLVSRAVVIVQKG